MIKVAISTLGCKVNQYESAGILEKLDKDVFLQVPFNTKADCYIINTCTVTGRTDYQSRQLIRRAIRKNPNASVIVTGCYAQVAPHDIARIPGVTLVVGNAEKELIPEIIQHIVRGNPQVLVSDICQAGELYGSSGIVEKPFFLGAVQKHLDARRSKTEARGVYGNTLSGSVCRATQQTPSPQRRGSGVFQQALSPLRFPGHTRAFLKIQDGCNNFCSYCIVPYARGPSRSLPEMEVFSKIEELALSGYREIVLTGIHLGAYGRDLIPPSDLFNILEYVEKNKNIERLRLSSIEIGEITDDLIGLMSKGAIICRHLHIPLQSGDDNILSAMNRNYESAFFKNRLEEICRAIPDIAFGIDVMVGFPGEREEEFNNTLRLIEELPVAYLHVFTYSERPGTHAVKLSGKVNEAVKKMRSEILREIGRKKRESFSKRFIGQKLTVLVEDKKDKDTGCMKGFSGNYIPVLIRNGNSSLANRIVNVIPDDSKDGKLYARIVSNV
ncbi:MAG TPA: tRNA (N(6)-L-threonylcarbamoyladenosine(37)-C(2))-methylthiotransferase MtaB [Syntrophales bacterium]|nr:tRNA (N(6)-L-threonylcarbamoyladenosine(37)-C(2))-methylthiotransferase MtaB [Syntrophales bacterium]